MEYEGSGWKDVNAYPENVAGSSSHFDPTGNGAYARFQ
jgi:hypothetical protein